MYINTPWTMPPFLYGFIASGGHVMGGVCQLIALASSILVYLPFVIVYEKQQNALEAQEEATSVEMREDAVE